MTRLYITNDGEKFFADDEKALVHQLREASNTPTPSDRKFMLDVAERIADMQGVTIPTDDPQSFVAALMKHGFVSEKEDD